jgi:L-alanine-DL-glutamate epimerase-like enolase superfamily enzyme
VVPRNRRASFAALALVALALSACYNFATPSFHPGEGRDLVSAIARQGVTIGSVLPGDSACDDPALVGNALRLAVTDPADGAERDVWIYTFRERFWDASAAQVDACQEAYQAAHPDVAVNRLDVPLYRVIGGDWSADLAESIRAGLADAAQAGQP